jgi:hypothetical protein
MLLLQALEDYFVLSKLQLDSQLDNSTSHLTVSRCGVGLWCPKYTWRLRAVHTMPSMRATADVQLLH